MNLFKFIIYILFLLYIFIFIHNFCKNDSKCYLYFYRTSLILDDKEIYIKSIIKNANKYIYYCNFKRLLNGIKKYPLKPKITSIIPSYNSGNKIKIAIKSIQNQKMEDIEILIIDDASTDKSLNIIKKLQKEDSRIKIVINKKNKGPLYSRSIGAIKARGKYLMHLDSDDLFINENIFNICYEEAEKNNIDILEFSGFYSKKKFLSELRLPKIPYYVRHKQNNLTIFQPELSSFIYKKKNNKIIKLIDGYLCGKCIRTKIYRKALKILGPKLYTQKFFYGEDRIINFILFRVANSFKFIQEYGFIYYKTSNSIVNSKNTERNCHDELINIMNIFHLSKNSLDLKIAIYELKHRWNKTILYGLSKNNRKYAKIMLKKMLKSKFITKKDTQMISNLLIQLNT